MFKLTKKQNKAWFSYLENPQFRRILFDGGARSGKTDVILAWLYTQASFFPKSRILAARFRRNAAKTTLWQSFKKLLENTGGREFNESDLECRLENGSVIRVDGLDDQERVDKILGDEFQHIFINEATQVSWPTVQTIITRLALVVCDPQGREGMRKLILDCNPKSQRHWLYKVGVRHVDPETEKPIPDAAVWGRLAWTPHDNPHLPTDFLASLDALPEVKRRRMRDGVWCENEGAVYDEFDEDIHVFRDYPAGWDSWRGVIRGIDFGYTNPFVCLWGKTDNDGRLWIFRERYVSKVICEDHAKAIRKHKEPVLWTVADHDAEDRATLNRHGVQTRAADKRIQAGIDLVKARLRVLPDGKPRLMIHESCKDTIAEFYDYVWPSAKEGKNDKETPIDDRNHAMDALRYIVMEFDGRRRSGLALPGMV